MQSTDESAFSRLGNPSSESPPPLSPLATGRVPESPSVAGETPDHVEEKIQALQEELRNSQQALDRARRRNRTLFDGSPEPYLLTDMSGVILDANRATGEFLGVPRPALIDRSLVLFVASPARRHFHAQLFGLSALPQRQQWTFSIKTRHRGKVRVSAKIALAHGDTDHTLELHWILHEDANVAWRLLTNLSIDETRYEHSLERALIRELDQVKRALHDIQHDNMNKTRLLASLSQDVRTPLHALMGYTQLLREGIHGPVTPQQASDLVRMQWNQEHLLRVATRISRLAHLDCEPPRRTEDDLVAAR